MRHWVCVVMYSWLCVAKAWSLWALSHVSLTYSLLSHAWPHLLWGVRLRMQSLHSLSTQHNTHSQLNTTHSVRLRMQSLHSLSTQHNTLWGSNSFCSITHQSLTPYTVIEWSAALRALPGWLGSRYPWDSSRCVCVCVCGEGRGLGVGVRVENTAAPYWRERKRERRDNIRGAGEGYFLYEMSCLLTHSDQELRSLSAGRSSHNAHSQIPCPDWHFKP